jgi:hypothetical protein
VEWAVSLFALLVSTIRGRIKLQNEWFCNPAPPDFLRSSGSGTGSTQPQLKSYLNGKVAAPGLENVD